jgi:hypothetical protein
MSDTGNSANGRYFIDLGLLIPGSVTPPQNGQLSPPTRGGGSLALNTAGNREDTVEGDPSRGRDCVNLLILPQRLAVSVRDVISWMAFAEGSGGSAKSHL